MRSFGVETEGVVVRGDFCVGAGESSSDEEMGSSSISRRRWFINRNRMLISLVRGLKVLGWMKVAKGSVQRVESALGEVRRLQAE